MRLAWWGKGQPGGRFFIGFFIVKVYFLGGFVYFPLDTIDFKLILQSSLSHPRDAPQKGNSAQGFVFPSGALWSGFPHPSTDPGQPGAPWVPPAQHPQLPSPLAPHPAQPCFPSHFLLITPLLLVLINRLVLNLIRTFASLEEPGFSIIFYSYHSRSDWH